MWAELEQAVVVDPKSDFWRSPRAKLHNGADLDEARPYPSGDLNYGNGLLLVTH